MLAFERHGSGEPLVLVHGITHRRQVWYPVLDQLAAQREVILVDLPGHGQSSSFAPEGRGVAEALRAEFRQFLTDQELDRPHIAGNSLGGRVALEAGAAGDARSVTALSPAGFWRTSASFVYTRALFMSAASVSERLGPRAAALSRSRAGRKLMYGAFTSHPDRISSDHALGDFRAFEYSRPALRLLLDAATPFDQRIGPEVPVTIAWAARDLVLPLWQAGVARELLPHAAHITLRGVGHVPMFDDPELVAQVLLRGSAPQPLVPSVSAATSPESTEPAVSARG
ncbi:MAG: alpha/beta fold hydrolase [Actinomycetota bacterium]|nr:alpha/beta fold hydrolase [Actinomycetota bacterium]